MVKVTPVDRDAAINLDELHIIQVWNIDRVAAAFARHRLEERAAIVAWLMREEADYPAGKYSGFAAMIREEIEAGEHLK